MISFEILDRESLAGLSKKLSSLGDAEFLSGVLQSFLEIAEEGAEVAVSAAGGALLVRVFEGRDYAFVYPIEVGEETDLDAALVSIAEYTVREMIPFYLTDVPREELDRLRRLFSHLDARAYSDDEDSFVAIIYSECDLLDEPPTVTEGAVTLSPITEADAEAYARLCLSEEVNKYWGYDARCDMPDGAGAAYFLDTAHGEFSRGVAISLAVREGGADAPIIGEAVAYSFDYRGGASVAVRLFPEYQGRGLGTAALSMLIGICRGLRLSRVRTEVMEENLPSLAMTKKRMPEVARSDGRVYFELEL